MYVCMHAHGSPTVVLEIILSHSRTLFSDVGSMSLPSTANIAGGPHAGLAFMLVSGPTLARQEL